MNKIIQTSIFLFLFSVISTTEAGLFDNIFGDGSPDDSEFEGVLAQQLPSFLGIDGFTVEASQNLGNDVDPLWGARFNSKLIAKTDLYVEDGRDGNATFLLLKTPSDSSSELYGKIQSTLFKGKWNHEITYDGNPIPNLGSPLNSYSGKIIIRDSEEEKQFYAEKMALQEKQEAERKILEAEKRRLAEEQKKKLQIFVEKLVGEWVEKYGGEISLNSSGNGVLKYSNTGRAVHIFAKLEGNKLILQVKKTRNFFTVLDINENEFTVQSSWGSGIIDKYNRLK